MSDDKLVIPEENSRQKKILEEYQEMAQGYDSGSEECGWNAPDMLEKCREKRIADALFQQDITKPWPFPRQSKDIAAATGVGEYLTDDELAQTIREAGQTLKSSGTLAFTFLPASESARPSSLNEQQAHKISYVRKLCEENGMELRSAEEFDAYRGEDGNIVRHVLTIGMKR